MLSTRFQTPVSKKTLNPAFAPTDATFNFPIYLSLADKLGVVELVIWDKDVLKREYLGEASLPLDCWFREDGVFAFDDPNNKVSIEQTCILPSLTYEIPGALHKRGFYSTWDKFYGYYSNQSRLCGMP